MTSLVTAQYDSNKNQVYDPNSRGAPAAIVTDTANITPGIVVISANAPVNADGRPDGTIYIQTV